MAEAGVEYKDMVVVDHMVTWMEWDDRLKAYVHFSGRRGQQVSVPDHVVAKMEKVTDERDGYGRPVDGRPRMLAPDDYEAWTGKQAVAADPIYALSDDQLMSMGPDDLLAKMAQVPGLSDRVLDLENARDKPRKPILAYAERVSAAHKGDDVSLGAPVAASQPLVPAKD